MLALLAGSPIVARHRDRTAPACRTPTRCAAPRRSPAPPATPWRTPRSVAGRELASAIDNPVVTADGRVESNGNFHGAPVAYVLDFLAIVVADLAEISERRTDRMLDVARSHGLPPFLADDPGVDSGHMIAQYTQAAIVSELKRLAVPGERRLDPVVGDAGGPRLDGLVGRPQAAPLRGRPHPGARDRDAHRRPRPRPARPAASRPGDRRRAGRAARRPCPARARPLPRPEIEATVGLVAGNAVVAAAETVTGPLA